ncbi:uncharacterized protein LOC119566288 isoform X2 [Chelonia mydas]|uniref:uncharacterized protein LOC119566288 isoform X2 n=1 Tax=Chelonia mydas TaxID=8469 RepID=UPI0018A20E85|nr:uncharacterized protein LOC119566288 isoform X2 [Chelonia mydas]
MEIRGTAVLLGKAEGRPGEREILVGCGRRALGARAYFRCDGGSSCRHFRKPLPQSSLVPRVAPSGRRGGARPPAPLLMATEGRPRAGRGIAGCRCSDGERMWDLASMRPPRGEQSPQL